MKKFFVIDLILFCFIVGYVTAYVVDRSDVDSKGRLVPKAEKVQTIKECPKVPVTL